MTQDGPNEKQDKETGDWISDLKPGASTEAKVDKGVEDTFPASDPAPKTGATGFIAPNGKDTAKSTDQGQGQPGTTAGGKP